MEDYKKKYEGLMKNLEHLYESVNPEWKRTIENYIPELKEDRDEEIRKAIIEHIDCKDRGLHIDSNDKVTVADALAWLEKQGKINWSEENDEVRIHLLKHFHNKAKDDWNGMPIKNIIAWLENQDPKKHEEELDKAYKCADEVQYRKGYEDAMSECEKQGKQETIDKVEPKFKVGDCIRHKGSDECHRIVTIDNNYYFCENKHALAIAYQDYFELVEQKPAWSDEQRIEGIIATLMGCVTRLSNYGNLVTGDIIASLKDDIEWLKSLKNKVQPQPKQEWSWSEEDEKMLNSIIDVLEVTPSARFVPIKRELMIPWLKSFKERMKVE